MQKNKLEKDRETGQKLATFFESRGWTRDMPNSWFHNGNMYFFITDDLLVFGFNSEIQVKTVHHLRIKLTKNKV